MLGHFRLLVATAAEQREQYFALGLGKGAVRTKILFAGKADQPFAFNGDIT